ncbi:adenylate cyclase [filamentous cyanobacterium CCP5]|nr:adenylate cyclase [filamentous cyanobacterium CCP5]
MGQEIERKFLVKTELWQPPEAGCPMRQGYLPVQDKRTVRVRIAGDRAYLTLKGPAQGLVRPEFEYPIPVADAEAILRDLCAGPLIEKTRYRVSFANLIWEVDEFLGDNLGLLLAEVELSAPDQLVELPPWAGLEVTDDPRYYNASLARYPFREWSSV